ncbi:MAG: hypothetical protein J6K45_04830 [Clostridia bacterium]|nr:hypothetical protein [Clostridia bacterium]
MLKGHVFAKQLFENPIFALFMDTFLNKNNGIVDYKNKMELTNNGSSIIVNSGCVCVRGRFIEEDTYTSINVGNDSAYCKLVIEIDLTKMNTESELNQVSYKIVKGTSYSYPELVKNDIVKNPTGIYQYELAKFKTGSSGIVEFEDTRTFLDFPSIYATIEKIILDMLNSAKTSLETELNSSREALEELSDEFTEKLNAIEEGTYYQKKILYGSNQPVPELGTEGDVYLRYLE